MAARLFPTIRSTVTGSSRKRSLSAATSVVASTSKLAAQQSSLYVGKSTRKGTSLGCGSFSRSYSTSPEEDAHKLINSGTEALETGDLELAKTLYERALLWKPDSAEALFCLGVVEWQLKNPTGAIKAWTSSLEHNPINASDIHTNLATALLSQSKPKKEEYDLALSHLKRAHEMSPDDGEISYNYAQVLEGLGHLEEARVQFEKALGGGVLKAAIGMEKVNAKLVEKKDEKK